MQGYCIIIYFDEQYSWKVSIQKVIVIGIHAPIKNCAEPSKKLEELTLPTTKSAARVNIAANIKAATGIIKNIAAIIEKNSPSILRVIGLSSVLILRFVILILLCAYILIYFSV